MKRGFTIIEVLIALTVFAYATIAMSAAYVNVLNAYGRVKVVMQTDEDVKFARASLVNQPDFATAEAGQEFDTTDGRHIKWTADIEDQGVVPDLFTVTFDCEITPADATQDPIKSEEVFTVLRPTWSDPATRTTLKNAFTSRLQTFKADPTQPIPAPASTP